MSEDVNAAQHLVARVDRKSNLFGSHCLNLYVLGYGNCPRTCPNGSGWSRETREAMNRISWASRRLSASVGLGKHAHDVALLHNQIVDAIDLDLGTGPFAEEHAIAGLQVEGNELSSLVAPAWADGNDLALLGLFLRSVRNYDPAGGFFLGLDTLEDDAIVEWTELHRILLNALAPDMR